MKRVVLAIITLALIIAFTPYVEAHPGRTDASGGHNCSDSAKSKKLCTGFHYHDKHGNSVYPDATKKPSTSKPVHQKHSNTTSITVFVNGEKLTFSQQSPIIKNGSTLVPMRAIFESLDASVSWDKATQKVTGKKGNNNVMLYINESNAQVNGKPYTLTQRAELLNGTTLVPLRFISESLGADVKWDNVEKTIAITL